MPRVEDDHVVETLTSNGADHPFDQWILPWGARCGKDLLHSETVDATVEVRSVSLVSISYQVPRRRIPWKSIDHLLRRPLGRRMFGDIEMNDTATVHLPVICAVDRNDSRGPIRSVQGSFGQCRSERPRRPRQDHT